MNRSLFTLKALVAFLLTGFALQAAISKECSEMKNSFFAPPMACNDLVHISLDTNCLATVTPDMLLEDLIGVPEDYLIQVFYAGNQLQPDLIFDFTDINKKYDYKIWHIASGNSCWGKILIEDKYPPLIICSNDTVRCSDDISPGQLGFPIPNWLVVQIIPTGQNTYDVYGWDRCGIVKLSYYDVATNHNCDSIYIRKIVRNWLAVDEVGNSAKCSDTICVLLPTEMDILYPRQYDGFDLPYIKCDFNFPKLPNGNPSPAYTGWPVPSGCTTLTASYSDLKISICGTSYKILRRWVILNWCTGRFLEFNQIIKVIDDEGPDFVCPKDLTIGMQPYNCYSDGKLPKPQSVVDCSDWTYEVFTKTIDSKLGTPNDQSKDYIVYDSIQKCYYLRGAPEGRIWIIYQLTDACGNTSSCTIEAGVVDNLSPNPVCDQKTVISLSIDGTAKALAETFDDGSFDNCGIDYFSIRRMDDTCKTGTDVFGPYVRFCCADVGHTVMLAFEATDFWGNKNTCMIEAYVQDKEAPVIIPPSDITIDCRFPIDFNDLSVFGKVRYNQSDRKEIIIKDSFYLNTNYIAGIDGLATDNCEVKLTERYDKSLQCNSGFIFRIFTVEDNQGLTTTAVQTITILNNHPFSENDIIWPGYVEINSCNNVVTHPDFTGYPQYINVNCAQIAANYDDLKLTVLDSTCYKILRKWVVIDWCQYDRTKGYGIWEYTQIIAVKSSQPPTIESCNPRDVCDQNSFYDPKSGSCFSGYVLTGEGFDDCTDDVDLIWSHRLDQDNDGSFDGPVSGRTATGILPLGTHAIRWILTDQCGNSSTCDQVFTIKDCKRPTPYCHNGVVTVIMPTTGTITVWAKDLNLNSFDNCTPADKLKYSFSPDTNYKSIDYNCDSLLKQKVITKTVTIFVTDESGNQDYCETTIRIQDNNNVCPTNEPGFNLSGHVKRENSDPIVDAEILLKDKTGTTLLQQTTNRQGDYAFQDLHVQDFYLTASKNDDITNGVSTLDIVLIQRHILGLKLLNSPYKLLAADVNNSQNISARDVSDIRRAILGIINEFPNGTPVWKFVRADYIFPNPEVPWEAPTTIKADEIIDQFDQLNFNGIKTGDVDLSADPGFNQGQNQKRTSTVQWYAKDNYKILDHELEIQIYSSGSINLDGFQFGIELLNPMDSIKSIIPAALDVTSENYYVQSGKLKVSWVSDVNRNIKKGEHLFSMIVKTNKQVLDLHKLFRMINHFSSEIYIDGIAYSLNIGEKEENQLINNRLVAYPVEPNPFSDVAILNFEISEKGKVSFEVYNVTGKQIYKSEKIYEQGRNQIIIRKEDLPVKGLLYYIISSPFGSSSERMAIIE